MITCRPRGRWSSLAGVCMDVGSRRTAAGCNSEEIKQQSLSPETGPDLDGKVNGIVCVSVDWFSFVFHKGGVHINLDFCCKNKPYNVRTCGRFWAFVTSSFGKFKFIFHLTRTRTKV